MIDRKPLTKGEYAFLAVFQGGLCGCGCGRPLDFLTPHAIRDEHLYSLALGGTNELKNRSLYIAGCTKLKDALDAGRRAKVRSLTGVNKKDQKPKAKINGNPKIQSRPFRQERYDNTRYD